MSWLDELAFDTDGLVPVVAQEALTGNLLMLAFANREAIEKTLETGMAHYWSRSRGRLWKKGETSGHTQAVVEIRLDCDGDTVLYRVLQSGPACHTLHDSCFFRSVENGTLHESGSPAHILGRVDAVVESRMREPKAGSYTSYLIESGLDKILKKIGEEATEVVVAAKNESLAELRAETADLLFHVIVLLRARGLSLDDVWSELEERFGRAPRVRSGNRERSPVP